MQVSSKLLFKTAIVLLGMMLAVTVFAAVSSSQKASALNSTQWETVRGYTYSYFNGQYSSARNGEAGLIKGKLDLRDNLGGTSGTGATDTVLASYLGEGDDMANRPVLLDNLMNRTDIVPGTEFRCAWNADQSCFKDTSVDMVKSLVDKHADAGFSTEIVDYCVSSHTASPVTAGWGIIAQTGGLSSDGDVPIVHELEWSRNGWTNSGISPFSTSGAIAAPEASPGFSLPTTPTQPLSTECAESLTGADLVRCTANWAIASTKGNVGNGATSVPTTGQTIDVRPGTISTINNTAANIQVPIDTLFSVAGLSKINPATSNLVISSTQHGGQTAMGLKMLGYNLLSGGYLNSGIPRYNSTQGEQQVAIGSTLPLATITAFTVPGLVDTTGPSVTSVAAENITQTSADIHRVAGEPATLKVEIPGVPTVNNTVLNADKTVTVSGLAPSTTYSYTATSYDGYANPTVSTGSFTTLSAPDIEDPVVTYVGPTGTISDNSPTVTGTATDNVGVTGAHLNLNGGPDMPCSVDGSGNISCSTSGLADGPYTAVITAHDAAGNTGTDSGSFTVSTCAAAKPALSLAVHHAFWASYADYTARNLTVRFVMSNTGSTIAYDVAITGATATNGVTLYTVPPVALGGIADGNGVEVDLQYHIPPSVTGFRTNVTASASDACGVGYTYP